MLLDLVENHPGAVRLDLRFLELLRPVHDLVIQFSENRGELRWHLFPLLKRLQSIIVVEIGGIVADQLVSRSLEGVVRVVAIVHFKALIIIQSRRHSWLSYFILLDLDHKLVINFQFPKLGTSFSDRFRSTCFLPFRVCGGSWLLLLLDGLGVRES